VGKTKYKWEPIGYDHEYIPAEAVKVANKAIYCDKVSLYVHPWRGQCAGLHPLAERK
jgi:hypothetical protein